MAVVEFSKLKAHNQAYSANRRAEATLAAEDVKDTVRANIKDFATQLFETRNGMVLDAKSGLKLPARNVSFSEAVSMQYGLTAPNEDHFGRKLSMQQKNYWVVKEFLKQIDVYTGSDTILTASARLGCSNITPQMLEQILVDHTQFNALANTTGVDADFRFIIPELILSAIRLDYDASSLHQNWIASTTTLSDMEAVMPQILRGNTVPVKIKEAESIPFGSVRFGKKKASVFKVGIGFKITDELVMRSSLDMIFTFLGEVGTDMSISADYEAYRVLRNGEQVDGSESAPVIGVTTTGAFSYKDIKRGTSRLSRLKRKANRMITGEGDGIDITSLDQFQGFNGPTRLAEIRSLIGVPDVLDADVYSTASGEIMLLDSTKAMTKLQWGSMKVEKRRNPQNQEDEVFVSDWVGFAIIRRDARLVIDKAQAFSSTGFPSYMDVDARINQSFASQL